LKITFSFRDSTKPGEALQIPEFDFVHQIRFFDERLDKLIDKGRLEYATEMLYNDYRGTKEALMYSNLRGPRIELRNQPQHDHHTHLHLHCCQREGTLKW